MESPDDRFSAALEHYLRTQLAGAGRSPEPNQVDLGTLVEQAGAAVRRVLSENLEPDQWLYFRIATASTLEANVMLATEIAPWLLKLKDDHSIQGWWWLNKSDTCGNAVRLRIQTPHRSRVEIETKARLEHFHREFTVLRYEPELRLFGGPAGMRIAHKHFCFDSEFLSKWMATNEPRRLPVIPEGLSLALILRLLRAAGLDLFESWDVFDRVCDKRPVGQTAAQPLPAIQRLAEKVVRSRPDRIPDLYEDKNRVLLREFLEFLDRLGAEINRCYFEGHLECGIREFLAPLILFHWNRVGIPGVVQSTLVHAVAGELAGMSRKGFTPAGDRPE